MYLLKIPINAKNCSLLALRTNISSCHVKILTIYHLS
jgi:hypothetical protein